MKHAREDYNRFQDPEGKIPVDEPVFIIRGQDKVGWRAVEMYASLAELSGSSEDLINRCKKHAQDMKDWSVKEVPDL